MSFESAQPSLTFRQIARRVMANAMPLAYAILLIAIAVTGTIVYPEKSFDTVTLMLSVNVAVLVFLAPACIESIKKWNVIGKIVLTVFIAYLAWPLPLWIPLLVGMLYFWYNPLAKAWDIHTRPRYKKRVRLGLIVMYAILFWSQESIMRANDLIFLLIGTTILFGVFLWMICFFGGMFIGLRSSQFIAEVGEQTFDLLPIVCIVEGAYSWNGFWGGGLVLVAYYVIERFIPRRGIHE